MTGPRAVVASGNDAMSVLIDILAGVCAGAGGAFSLVVTSKDLRIETIDDADWLGHQMAITIQEDPLSLENVRQRIQEILLAYAEHSAPHHG